MSLISKSRYLDGLQCEKLLWHRFNAKKAFPPVDASTQAVFDQGHDVGRLAKQLFPGGIEIGGKPWEYEKLLTLTQEALWERRPLFEAAFTHNGAFARVDILRPADAGLSKQRGADQSGKGKRQKKRDKFTDDLFADAPASPDVAVGETPQVWDIVEVKSSTSVKDVNLIDLALQWYVVEGAGLKVGKCFLAHINNEYVRRGELDLQQLFHQVDVTAQVAEIRPTVAANLKKMETVIALRGVPPIPIGPHCRDPYDCPLIDLCWKDVPENSPLTLYRFDKPTAFDLLHRGFSSIADIPSSVELNDKQQIQVGALRSGTPHVDPKGISDFLGKLRHPLCYLDFESFNSAIPILDGTRPYQQVPFQFSLHVQREKGGPLEHHSWLAEGDEDPRREMLSRLRELLGGEGSIVAYNAPFELRILEDSVGEFSEYGEWFESLKERFVDLLEPFRGFAYYNPSQRGSASMKVVLPALVGASYEGMTISDGEQASREYMRVTFGKADENDRRRIRKALEEYCGLDTKGMVDIVDRLAELSGGG